MTYELERKLLPIDLQFFAEQDEDEDEDQTDKDDETLEDEDLDKKDDDSESEEEKEEDAKFTQEDLDRIVQERLKREREKQERKRAKEKEEQERKKAEEDEDFKKLAETYKQEAERLKTEQNELRKRTLLSGAGYDEDQVERYVKYIDGETEDEMQDALETLKADIPPKKTYADPKPGNGKKQTPPKKDLTDKGKSVFQRLKQQGRIK